MPTRREFLGWLGGLGAGSWMPTKAQNQGKSLRIGVILPTQTGPTPLQFLSSEVAGEIAYLGATFAAEEVGGRAESLGYRLEVRIASAPNTEASMRAASRLISAEEVFALVGGFSLEECLALGGLAQRQRVPLVNIGCSSDSLRGASCNGYTFHLEASTAMYLDALIEGFARFGVRRWFVVYLDSDEGTARYRSTLQAIQKYQGSEAGSAKVNPEERVFAGVLQAIRKTRPEGVLVLAGAADQLSFFAEYNEADLGIPITGFPDPVAQTRLFFNSLITAAPKAAAGYRAMLWETTLKGTAEGLNERFMSRFGQPLDPSAWAAYQAIKLLLEAAVRVGTEASKIINYLESPRTTFDLAKGPGVSFRPWDHQLRQPLYLVKLSSEPALGQQLSRRVNLAGLAATLPSIPTPNPSERLDQLGDSRQKSQCRFN